MDEIDGKMLIRLHLRDERVALVNIHSNSGFNPADQLISQTLSDLPEIITKQPVTSPYAFRIAADMAIEDALGVEKKENLQLARQLLLSAEAITELLSRDLIQWKKLLDEEGFETTENILSSFVDDIAKSLFSAEGNEKRHNQIKELIDHMEETLANKILGMPTVSWMAMQDQDQVMSWIIEGQSLGARMIGWLVAKEWEFEFQTGVPFLVEEEIADVAKMFQSAYVTSFLDSPDLNGACRETGCYARQHKAQPVLLAMELYGQGLIPRMFATLTDLAFHVQQMKQYLGQLSGSLDKHEYGTDSGNGLAAVESTSGKLIHHVEIEQGCVRNFQVVVPSQWNFHRQGTLTQMLTSLKNSDDLELFCRLIIGSLDPCVDYELQIS